MRAERDGRYDYYCIFVLCYSYYRYITVNTRLCSRLDTYIAHTGIMNHYLWHILLGIYSPFPYIHPSLCLSFFGTATFTGILLYNVAAQKGGSK
ncbi:hypothetical protein GDO78_003736 [Eleutherodactylus coqui]|uniref:Uncharacterized protein n=1 Tax=Eleutherodactylus coqui TaxID=57060 RepID=A0A8J6EUT4_ELECQ|nr:hypothetical protein GDO78_003736 [Eleutherodactylus coqui]